MVYSTKELKIPAKIQETCHIETNAVLVDIPLLFSKASMKRAGTVLDMENDNNVMFSQPVKLDFTSSCHYCVSIMDNNKRIQFDEQALATAEDNGSKEKSMKKCTLKMRYISEEMSSATKEKILLKLRKQFGHASADRLHTLLKSSRNNDTKCHIIKNC